MKGSVAQNWKWYKDKKLSMDKLNQSCCCILDLLELFHIQSALGDVEDGVQFEHIEDMVKRMKGFKT